MNYFVTGATGFIGRNLVQRLLQREGTIYALVRAGSRGRLEELRTAWGADGARVVPISGDLSQPGLGVSEEDLLTLRGDVDHFFHLAAIYDMTAGAEAQEVANVEGTRHAVELAGAIEAGCFHQISSIAAAGLYKGELARGHVRGGRKARHPSLLPHQARVRAGRARGVPPALAGLPARDRRRRLAQRRDRQDRRALLRLQAAAAGAAGFCRPGCRRSGSKGARSTSSRSTTSPTRSTTSPTSPASTARPSSLTDPAPKTAGEMINLFARAADAPQAALRLDSDVTDPATSLVRTGLRFFPPAKRVVKAGLGPSSASQPACSATSTTRPTSTRPTPRRRWRARASRCRRWSPTPTASGTTGSAPSIPTSSRTAR